MSRPIRIRHRKPEATLRRLELFDAIYHLDMMAIKNALTNGAMINNENCKSNTLNRCIQALLSVGLQRFNLNFIKDIIDSGAQPCNCNGAENNSNNTLTHLLKITEKIKYKFERRIRYAKLESIQTRVVKYEMIQNNIITIVQLLLQNGAVPDNSDNPKQNTLHWAVMSNNLKLIKILRDYGAMAANNCYINTLSCAIDSLDPEIVKYVILGGGKGYKDNCIFNHFFVAYQKKWESIGHVHADRVHVEQILNLIMCSGAKPRICTEKYEEFVSYKKRENIRGLIFVPWECRSWVESKIITCHELLFHSIIYAHDFDRHENKVNKLRAELKKTMNELVEKKRISEIDSLITNYLPVCLIDLIYEYYVGNYVEFIDWDNV